MHEATHATSLDDPQVKETAALLFDAFSSGVPVDPPTALHAQLTVDDAYRIQRAVAALHEARGRRVVGRKIGLTSLAMQQQLGIDSPDFGLVFDSHAYAAGSVLSRSGERMIAPKLEPELAVVLSRELAGPGVTADDVADALESVVAVLEIIDSRVRDWKITLADTVADNASCFGVVTGAPVAARDAGPLAAARVAMMRDGEIVQQGEGTAVLGDPLEAVAWLANALGRFGERLPARQPILCGSFTAAVDAVPAMYVADFGPAVGSVFVEITQ